ncbi:MAG: HD domain-containing protein [Treponema sp.]|nr:HD domain-containing protein [Treponema sp.]
MLQRLKGIGLLCGTDWTKLYKNRFYYSRLDHSVGVALIIWHFTHDKAQTIAGLLHDVSTSVFSHVSDFRKGDALTQTVTEAENESIIHSNNELKKLLESDNLTIEQIEDYHKYPIADNEIPQLSADRLEYMFPSGMALDGTWDLPSIERAYNDIEVLTNENGEPELGFKTLDIAVDYCRRFCMIGHILQLNENKLTLHLLGQIMNLAVETNLLTEQDFMLLSEKEILEKLEAGLKKAESSPKVLQLDKLYKTFRNMTKIEHTTSALSETEYFSVSLRVKQRYINPLVKNLGRVKDNSPLAAKIIQDFLTYEDSKYGCVKLINDL